MSNRTTTANQSPNPSFPLPPDRYAYPGARWWRVDFHAHSPASWDYGNGSGSDNEKLKNQSPEDWLKQHMDCGLDAVVVTDHNTTDFIQKLRDAYQAMDKDADSFRPLVIYPGFELTVNGGLHLLAVFDPQADLAVVSGTIEACGYGGTRGESDTVTSESFENCLKIIREKGGLTIAAHIDEACGLLWKDAAINGKEVRQLMRSENLTHAEALTRAIENGIVAQNILDYSPTVDMTLESILKIGIDALEVRNWSKLSSAIQEHSAVARLARVTGSDSHRPQHIGRYGFSIVHMTEPNLEGLRMAFADGSAVKTKNAHPVTESWSVRPIGKDDTTDWNRWPDQALEKLTLSNLKVGGRQTPLEIPLHPRLNVLVGGRGSGKSTIVHALRLATDRGGELPRYEDEQPIRESPAGDFWRWAQVPSARGQDGVILKNGTQPSSITVLYRSPAQQAALLWNAALLGPGPRTGSPTVCVGPFDAQPTEYGGAYSSARFPISIYSQKQVLEMSRGSAGLLDIIDREQNVSALEEQLEQTIAAYGATRAKIREHQSGLANEAQDAASLKDILLELEKVQSDVVKEYQKRQAQARSLLPNLAADSAVLVIAQELETQADRLCLPDIPEVLVAPDDVAMSSALAIYQATQKQFAEIALQIKAQASTIRGALGQLNLDLRAGDWWQACLSSKSAYDALIGAQTGAVDANRLAKLNQDRVQLEDRLVKYKGNRDEITRLEASATDQLAAVRAARMAISQTREAFIASHNAKGTLLRMSLVQMGAEVSSVEHSLRDALGVDGEKFSNAISVGEGSRNDALLHLFLNARTPEIGSQTVRQRVLALIDSTDNAQGFADLQNNLRRQISSTPSRREAIETWSPDDRLDLAYRTSASGEWKSISQGSIGQQTAAILSFLLSFGNEPLILDQPEDDLDTRMIMSLIVEQVRAMKERRQIIIVTHNPNIVVHGDADLVHAMEDRRGQVHRLMDASGGLQQRKTRDFVCNLMEGGAVAFRRRFDRMGGDQP